VGSRYTMSGRRRELGGWRIGNDTPTSSLRAREARSSLYLHPLPPPRHAANQPASQVLLYHSLIFIVGVVLIRSVMAVMFSWSLAEVRCVSCLFFWLRDSDCTSLRASCRTLSTLHIASCRITLHSHRSHPYTRRSSYLTRLLSLPHRSLVHQLTLASLTPTPATSPRRRTRTV
jgi:hypothetical protein